MLQQLLASLNNIIAPPFCLACSIFLDEDTVLCAACIHKIKPLVSKTIQLTKTKSMPVFAIGAYEYPLRSLILAKSRSNRAVSYQLGNLIWEHTYIRNKEFDAIVPIPLHWTRYAWRGYNQAEVMARVIAEKTNKPIINLLNRIKRTPYQSYLSGEQRTENVRNVFALAKQAPLFKHKKLLLVDDLMTTGATLHAAAKTLLRLKPQEMTAAVAARVI